MQNSFYWTETGVKCCILLRSWQVRGSRRCTILWPQPKKFCIFWAVNIHKYYQLNTFSLIPRCKNMKATKTWWTTSPNQRWHLVLWPWRSWSFMDGHDRLWPQWMTSTEIVCDQMPPYMTICDYLWLTNSDDHLFPFGKNVFLNNSSKYF